MLNSLRAVSVGVCHKLPGTLFVQAVKWLKNCKRSHRRCAHGCMLPPAIAHFDFPNGSVKSRAGLPADAQIDPKQASNRRAQARDDTSLSLL